MLVAGQEIRRKLKQNAEPMLNDDLLARYLAGETSPNETKQVEDWAATSDDNRRHLEAFRVIWEQSADLPQTVPVNTDAAWQKVQKRLQTSSHEVVVRPLHNRRATSNWLFRFAASVVLLFGLGWVVYLYFIPSKVAMIALTTQNFQLEKTLPDGTLVFLNANTQLSYPAEFEGNTREVSLKGEAFFNVKPDATKPFVIQANGTAVKVLGTSFNVKAYDANVQVLVETGKVAFGTTKKQVFLTPGETARFEAKSDTIVKAKALTKNDLAYKTKIFLFEETPLSEVIKSLGEAYQIEIMLKNKRIRTCKLTATFENQNLDTILANLAETFELTIEKQEGKILLDGKGCD